MPYDKWLERADWCNLHGWHPIPTGRVESGDKDPKYKIPWLAGTTGKKSDFATPDKYPRFLEQVREMRSQGVQGILSLGLRCAPDRIGIDIDTYAGKSGLESLAELEQRFGKLPPAPVVTARPYNSGSGIRLYAINPHWLGEPNPAPGIELVQWWHRHIQGPPSWHYTGSHVRAYDEAGKIIRNSLPPADLPMLPKSWHEGLLYVSSQGGLSESLTDAEFGQRYSGGAQEPSVLNGLISSKLSDCDETHTPMLICLSRAAEEARGGRYGWAGARDQVRRAAEDSYQRRGKRLSERDFAGAVRWAIDQALTKTEQQCYNGWQADGFSNAGADFDSSPWAGQETSQPTDTEIRSAARKLILNREAKRLVDEQDAQRLLAASNDQAVDGLAFLETIETGSPVWGGGNVVPWASEQGFMVFGTDGTGKSTIIQQIVLARLGLRDANVIGFDVATDERPILYLALDRPTQIRQSIARMIDLADPDTREVLKRRLVVWTGHLPFQCDASPERFVDWCVSVGGDDVGMIIGDSVKDMVSSCTEDQAGSGFQQTVQRIVSRGIEFGCCHHNRKANALNTKPNQLQDVYGSRWLTAGLGSVLNIWRLSDTHRELTQLKAPYGSPLRPVEYADDYVRGVSAATDRWTDVLASALTQAGGDGLTDAEIVSAVFDASSNSAEYNSFRQKANRVLKAWVEQGKPFERVESQRNEKPCKVWRAKNKDQ